MSFSFDNPENPALMKFGNGCEIGCASKTFAAFIAASGLGHEVSQSYGHGSGVENLAAAGPDAGIGR